MPLVRIDLPASVTALDREAIAEVVYDALVNVAGVPENDRFIIISEHGASSLVMDPSYVVERTERALVIQITLNTGHAVEVKRKSRGNCTARSPTGCSRPSGCAPRTCSSTWSRFPRRTGPSAAGKPRTPTSHPGQDRRPRSKPSPRRWGCERLRGRQRVSCDGGRQFAREFVQVLAGGGDGGVAEHLGDHLPLPAGRRSG